MSEFWVSKKKYFCKYCDIYIADDVPSRQQHENGLRHKGNKERFVRSLYKTSEKRKHDLEEEKREMVRVERAAQAAFAQDVGSGVAKASSSVSVSAPHVSAPIDKPSKPASAWTNYSTAESLGYTDPDVERAKAEAERRRTQGVAGEWQMVASAPSTSVEPVGEEGGDEGGDAIGKKREAEPVDEDDSRAFKVRKKAWSGLGEVWDPESVPIKLKVKKREENESREALTGMSGGVEKGASRTLAAGNTETSQATLTPKWTSRGWNKPGEANTKPTELSAAPAPSPSVGELGVSSELSPDLSLSAKEELEKAQEPSVKLEDTIVKSEDALVKLEESLPATSTSMFKKRKAPIGSAGSRSKR